MHAQLSSGDKHLNFGLSLYLRPFLVCASSVASGNTACERMLICALTACQSDKYQNTSWPICIIRHSLTMSYFQPVQLSLSSDREHFSNTDLSDLRIVGTCGIRVYRMRHQIM